MRRRLTASILAIAVLAVVLFGLPLLIVVPRFVDERAALRLERRAVLASRQVPIDSARTRDPVEFPGTSEIRYSVYDGHGLRVSGAGPRRGDAVVRGALHNRVDQAEVGETRVVAIPIVDRETVVGALRASEPTTVADRQAQRAIVGLILLAVGVIGVGAVVARFVAGRLTRPVGRLRDQAVRLGEGDFALTITPTGIPELDDAGIALVATARRLEDLVRRERAFSADASHQLRTPLAALRATIEAELQFPRGSNEPVLTEALEDIARLEATIEQLLAFARTSVVSGPGADVAAVLEQLRAQWHGVLAAEGRPLVVTWPHEELAVAGSSALLREALDTLVDNAVRHGAGEVRVEARCTEESVTIAIADQGPGFLAEPSADAGASSDGTHGFGLPLARRLIEAQRGRLVVARRGPDPVVEVVLRRKASA